MAEAKKQQIQLGDWFLSPIHPNLESWSLAGYTQGCCPVAEEASRCVVNIPTDKTMSENEISRTVSFLSKHGNY